MMTEKEEMQIFQLISAAGAAKSEYMEAVQTAKKGNYEEAEARIKQGDKYYLEGHEVHADMLSDIEGPMGKSIPLILAHAEDQMLSAETVKIMAEELIALYKIIKEK